jgi:[acyl-carrier-protein] S-malonyltransferase
VIALVFPGQGVPLDGVRSWREESVWGDVEAMARDAGVPLLDAVLDDGIPSAESMQLGVFGASLLALLWWQRTTLKHGLNVDVVAGHSFGQIAALVASSVITPEEAVRIVAARADATRIAVVQNPGVMSAIIRREIDDVARAIAETGADACWIANDNGPGQTVIAGEATAVGVVEAKLERPGTRILRLPINGAYHTPLMAPAAARMRSQLTLNGPRVAAVPIVLNVDARERTLFEDPVGLMADHLITPVAWRASVARMTELGVDTFVELGPGGVIGRLVKRLAPSATIVSLGVPSDVELLESTLLETIGV